MTSQFRRQARRGWGIRYRNLIIIIIVVVGTSTRNVRRSISEIRPLDIRLAMQPTQLALCSSLSTRFSPYTNIPCGKCVNVWFVVTADGWFNLHRKIRLFSVMGQARTLAMPPLRRFHLGLETGDSL